MALFLMSEVPLYGAGKGVADLFLDSPEYNAHGTATEAWLPSRVGPYIPTSGLP